MIGTGMDQFWTKVLSEVSSNIPSQYYGPFISPLSLESYDADKLVIKAPSHTIKDHVQKKYKKFIEEAIAKIHGKELSIEFSIDDKPIHPISGFVEDKHSCQYPTINPDYKFDNFIAGESNRLVIMAAQEAANPQTAVTSLFIQGSLGVGKTHLMQAIANQRLFNNPHLKIIYTTLSSFLSEFVYSVQNRELMDKFRMKYLNCDSLYIDDIQHLNSGAEKTQEEFFYIFNHLCENHKQIIITSDRPCRDLPIQERLKSRMITGYQVELKQPDEEARIQLLIQKANPLQLNVSENAISYIAQNIKTDVRSLIGALNDIYMYKKAYNLLIISDDQVKDIIENRLLKLENLEYTQDKVINTVSEEFSVAKKDVLSKSRKAEFIIPRHLSMYLLFNVCHMNKTTIGRIFNTKHTTVINAIKKIDQRIEKDGAFARIVKSLIGKFQYK